MSHSQRRGAMTNQMTFLLCVVCFFVHARNWVCWKENKKPAVQTFSESRRARSSKRAWAYRHAKCKCHNLNIVRYIAIIVHAKNVSSLRRSCDLEWRARLPDWEKIIWIFSWTILHSKLDRRYLNSLWNNWLTFTGLCGSCGTQEGTKSGTFKIKHPFQIL